MHSTPVVALPDKWIRRSLVALLRPTVGSLEPNFYRRDSRNESQFASLGEPRLPFVLPDEGPTFGFVAAPRGPRTTSTTHKALTFHSVAERGLAILSQ